MATLTIRNLDEDVKAALRRRAAERGVSMEQEARTILKVAVGAQGGRRRSDGQPGRSFYESVRELVEPHGGFDMAIPDRSKDVRTPPRFD